MADNTELARLFEAALSSNDFDSVMELLQTSATDDFVQEWPQSGERLSKEGSLRLAQVYGEKSGTAPTFSYRRMVGGGDIFVIEGTMDYGDGEPVSYVGVGEIRDGKVARMTEYFANPFPAPEWRAEFVEKAG